MADSQPNGTIAEVEGRTCIFYDGYWIRYYEPPEDRLIERKALIDTLTRRLFHHTEAGINTPGERLEMAREAYERETDPTRKRVNAAMLAGALFNRATDIFNSVVDLASKGVEISSDNELMGPTELDMLVPGPTRFDPSCEWQHPVNEPKKERKHLEHIHERKCEKETR